MANPKIGQSATLNGKKVVWSGQNYGWQSPATHKKLANDGKFRVGTQALDRLSQSVSRAIPKPIKNYAKGVAQEGARQQAAKDRVLNRAGISTKGPNATERTLDAASKATNVDRRIVGAAASVAQAAISKKALGGSKAQPQPRSVGAAAKADVASRTTAATKRLPTTNKSGVLKSSKAPSSNTLAARRADYNAADNRFTAALRQKVQANKADTSKPNRGLQAQPTAKPKPDTTPRTNRGLQAERVAKQTLRKEVDTQGTKRQRARVERATKGKSANQVAREAGGPIKPKSDGTEIARGNTVERSTKADKHAKTRNKDRAVTEFARRTTDSGTRASIDRRQQFPTNKKPDVPLKTPSGKKLGTLRGGETYTNKTTIERRRKPGGGYENVEVTTQLPRTKALQAQAAKGTGKGSEARWNDATKAISDKARDSREGQAFMPRAGRTNPMTSGTLQSARNRAESAGSANRTAARSKVRAVERKVSNRAKAEASAYQNAQAGKRDKGTSASNRNKMANSVGRKLGAKSSPTATRLPKDVVAKNPSIRNSQGPVAPGTKTTGTKRVAANPSTNSSTGTRARVIDMDSGRPKLAKPSGKTVTARSKPNETGTAKPTGRAAGTNKYTQREAFNLTESEVRQGARDLGRNFVGPRQAPKTKPSASVKQPRGGNPAENFPAATRARKVAGDERLAAKSSNKGIPLGRDGRPVRSPSAPKNGRGQGDTSESSSIRLKSDTKGTTGPGLNVRQTRSGNTSGIRPAELGPAGRGSTTPTHYKGSATKDTVQTRNGRSVRRLGQSGEWNIDTPATRKIRADRAAAEKADKLLERLNGKRPEATPKRSSTAKERLAKSREALKATRGQRKSQPKTEKGLNQLKRGYDQTLKKMDEADRRTNPNYDGSRRRPARTHISGEVRIGGSKFGTDPKTAKMVDGSVTRTVGRTKKGGRSAEATAQSNKTMEAVRARRAAKAKAKALVDNPSTKTMPGKKKSLTTSKPEGTIKARASAYAKGVRNAVDRKGNDLNYLMRQSLKSLGF